MELVLFIAAIVMLVMVPFGTAGSCFALVKFIKRRQRLQRFIIEFHTAFLTMVVVLVVVPLTCWRLFLSMLQCDSVATVKVVHTVLMQILQVVQLCNVKVIALKRARTMTRADRQLSISTVLTLIIMCWVIGIAVGVTPTITALISRNSTDGMHSYTSRLEQRSYFDAIYVALLLVTSLVMFVSYLSVRRHINSTIASTSAAGRSLIDRVYTIGALAKGLGDSMSLQFVTAHGRRTTVISNPVVDDENGVVTSKVVVDNWISEKPTTELYKSTDTASAAYCGQTSHGARSRLCNGSSDRPVSFSLINIPVLGAMNSFDTIREESDEGDDVFERLSLTNCAQQRQDNLSVGEICPSPISGSGLWVGGVNKGARSEHSDSCSISCRHCGVNDNESATSHCKCTGNTSPRSLTPIENEDEYIEITERITSSCRSHNSLIPADKIQLHPSQKMCNSSRSSRKMCLSPCALSQHNSEGEIDHDRGSVSSMFSSISMRSNNSSSSPTGSDKCCELLSITSDLLHPSDQYSTTNKRFSLNSIESTTSLPPLKHTRCSPSSISLNRPPPLLRRSSSIRQLFNKNGLPITHGMVSVRDSSIQTMPEKRISWASYHNIESVFSNSKDVILSCELPTEKSASNGSVPAPCLACRSSPNEPITSREDNISYEKQVFDINPSAVQIRVTRPSTEAVRFLSRRNGLVQDFNAVLGGPQNVSNGVHTRRQSKVALPRCSNVRKITQPEFSSDHTILCDSSRQFSVQHSNLNSFSAPFRHKTLQYKEIVVRRFFLAFVMNVLTQVPNVVLELLETPDATYSILSPIFQSIAIISFLLNPYIYVLGNKFIHKTITMRRF